jgi:hypothetical protein
MINSNGNVDWGNDIAFAKNLTLALTCGRKRERSGRWRPSGAVRGSAWSLHRASEAFRGRLGHQPRLSSQAGR